MIKLSPRSLYKSSLYPASFSFLRRVFSEVVADDLESPEVEEDCVGVPILKLAKKFLVSSSTLSHPPSVFLTLSKYLFHSAFAFCLIS
jgi:hypothetical protein